MFTRVGALSFLLIATIPLHAEAQSSAVSIVQDSVPTDSQFPVPANPLDMSDADYPLESLIANEEGRVTLNLIVNAEGRVAFAQRLISSGFDRLDQAAIQIATARWMFRPAIRDGQPTVGSVKVDVAWSLPLEASSWQLVDTDAALDWRKFRPPIPLGPQPTQAEYRTRSPREASR